MRWPYRCDDAHNRGSQQHDHQHAPRNLGTAKALVIQDLDEGPAQAEADEDAHDRAKERNLHRLQRDHPADLAALRTHRTQHANLLAALDNTQGQGIDNAQHGNDHGECEKTVEDSQHPVDGASGLTRVFLTSIDLHHHEVLDGILDAIDARGLPALLAGDEWRIALDAWQTPMQLMVAPIMIVAGIVAVRARKRYTGVVLVSVTGLGMVVLFATSGAPDLALLTDGLRAEREQGITIDVAYRYFATDKRTFILADTPGHVQYTRNTVTGMSTTSNS